jgi:hypothetical protein
MLSIVLATKNSNTLKACLENIKATTKGEYEVILVDAGAEFDHNLLIINPTRYVKVWCRTCLVEQFNIGFAMAPDFLITIPDDHFPQKGWDEIAFKSFYENFPDDEGFLVLNEGIRNGSMGEIALTNRDFINKYCGGYWFHHKFKHFRCSPELWARAKRSGKTAYCAEAKIDHRHKPNGSERGKYWAHDHAIYKELMRNNV